MKKSIKNFLILMLVFALVVSVFTGCGKKNKTVGYDVSNSKYGNTYPIKGAENVTLGAIMNSYNPLADTAALKAAPTAFESLRNDYNLRNEVK